MKNLSKSEKALLAILIISGIFFVYFKFFLSPMISKISTVRTEVVSLKDEVNKLTATKTSNKALTKQISELENQYNESSKVLPQSDRNPEIAYTLKNMSDTNALVLGQISMAGEYEYNDKNVKSNPDQGANNNNGKRYLMIYPTAIIVFGDYGNIMSYISGIEANTRIAEINGLSFLKKLDGPYKGKIEAKIEANYFYNIADINAIKSGDQSNVEIKYDFNEEKIPEKLNLFN